jgi:hypothetical protein
MTVATTVSILFRPIVLRSVGKRMALPLLDSRCARDDGDVFRAARFAEDLFLAAVTFGSFVMVTLRTFQQSFSRLQNGITFDFPTLVESQRVVPRRLARE